VHRRASKAGDKEFVWQGFVIRFHGNFIVKGDQMGNLDLADTLKALQVERVQARKALRKLDKAIAVIRALVGTQPTPNGRPKKRTMSAAARRKIGKAQKLRWAKFGERKKAKA
jgi:hypothetical protein